MEQLCIPMPPQPRATKREPRPFYAAVLMLRREGYRIRRCGRSMHIVDGKRVPSRVIWDMARAVERGIA